MLRSLYSAISGLNVNQKSMDVIGNNISNVNTVGYKAGRAVFQDLLSQTIIGGNAPTDNLGGINPSQIGLGSQLAGVDNLFEDGTPLTTSKTTDLAIQGDGFFVLSGGDTGEDLIYTRAGDFTFDRNGNLTNPAGYKVQGWMTDMETGLLDTDTEVSDINLDEAYQTIQAQATSEISLSGVLNTEAEATILEYPELLHFAESTDDLFSVFSTDGVQMDILESEPVKIKAHGTAITDMKNVHNDSDVNLNLENSSNLIVYMNNTAYTFSYVTAGANPAAGVGTFTTYDELRQCIENQMNALNGSGEFSVSLAQGKLTASRTGAVGTDITVNSFSGTPYLSVALEDLGGTYYDGSSRTAEELFFEDTVYAGRDFNTLNELAADIEQAIDNNVLASANFAAAFNDTTGTFDYTVGGATDLTGFSIDKAYSGTVFETNVVPSSASTITAGSTESSEQFLRYAKGTDLLTDLYTTSGDSLGLDATAVLQLSGSISDEDLTGVGSLAVAGSSLDDMRVMIADYMGYPSTTESELQNHIADIEDNGGKLKVTGEKGIPNEIDWLKWEVLGSAPDYNSFYDYFEYQTVQSAEGGRMVTSQTIYDSQGNDHTVSYTFELDSTQENTWTMAVSTTDPDADVAFNNTGGDSVVLHFNQDGSFNYITNVAGTRITDLTYDYNPNNGAGTIAGVEVGVGTPALFDGLYLSNSESSISRADQDGYTVGSLERELFNQAGEIVGYYTNGQVKVLGQVALGLFTNPQGLLKVGDTVFSETSSSGQAAIGKPGTSFRGDVASGSLENSNVDLSREFVNMITTQRGFQANSRVITTSDEMLQELLTLKR